MILELFRVERDAIDRGLFGTDQHLAMRVRRSKPVLDQLKTWIDQQEPLHLPEGPMGAALRYITNQYFSILYTLVQTAERHGVNSLNYLEDVLMRVQTHPARRIEELLPDRWKQK